MLQTEHLSFTYPAEEGQTSTVALEDVSLSIERGSFVVVLGHNGSGKSTLAKHMNAVLLPSGGTVYVEGMDTRDEALLLEIRRRVGMVFQNPDNQIVATVVEEDVAFGLENNGVPPKEIRVRIDDALRARGIAGVAGSDPETPLLVNLGRGRNAHGPMTRSGLYVVLTKFLEEVALDVASERPMDAAKLRASSTHWLRHTFAVNALTEMSVNVVQAAMGHASVATTGRYLSPEEEAMSEAMEKMKAL